MKTIRLIFVITYALIFSGCTVLGAASMIGSTISRAVEIQKNKKAREPANSQVAFTNVNLGVEYMRQGHYETALDKFHRAIDADPDYALSYNVLGVLYQLLGDAESAEENFKHSLKLEPDNPSTLNNYGQFLCKQAREKEAEEYFLAATSNPFYETPEVAYANAGSCAYMHKHTDVALQYFDLSLEKNPNLPIALSQLAEINFDNGDFISARDYMQRYLKNASHTPKTLWLGIRIERYFNNLDRVASYSLLLRNQYPDTREAELLRISEGIVRSNKTAPSRVASKSNPGKAQANKLEQIEAAQNPIVHVATPELLDINKEIFLADDPIIASAKTNDNIVEKITQAPATTVITLTSNTDTQDLLGQVDLSFYPLLLQEKDLLNTE